MASTTQLPAGLAEVAADPSPAVHSLEWWTLVMKVGRGKGEVG